MSLHSDYSHYYTNSWVALVENEVMYPLYVQEVLDRSRRRESDYSEAHRQQLYLQCVKYFRDGNNQIRSENLEVQVLDPRLILESPDVGYVKIGSVVRWTCIRPVRQRLKGLAGNKIQQIQVNHRQGELMYDLFNPDFEGLLSRYCYVSPSTNFIFYKGAKAGRLNHEDQTVEVLPLFSYIFETHIQPDYPPYNLVEVESL